MVLGIYAMAYYVDPILIKYINSVSFYGKHYKNLQEATDMLETS